MRYSPIIILVEELKKISNKIKKLGSKKEFSRKKKVFSAPSSIMLRRKTKTQGATTQDTATENQFWRLVKDDQGLLSVNGNAPAQASEMSTTNESSSRSFIARVFLRTVLPVGYPQSVAPEYVKFQLYDTLQEASGYFRGFCPPKLISQVLE